MKTDIYASKKCTSQIVCFVHNHVVTLGITHTFFSLWLFYAIDLSAGPYDIDFLASSIVDGKRIDLSAGPYDIDFLASSIVDGKRTVQSVRNRRFIRELAV
jgi:hypothetical protein